MHANLRVIFEREIANEGGIAHLSRFPEVLQPMLRDVLTEFREILASTANAPEPYYIAHNVYVNLIDNPALNAVAFQADGQEFIGVNSGSLLFLYDSFLALFSHPRFMPDVGQSDKELTSDDDLRNWLERENITHILEYVPTDPARTQAAKFLTVNAYNFILSHEVGHITKGHLRYLERVLGVPKNFAYADTPPAMLALPLRHALEIGADENAAHGSLHMFKPRTRTSGKILNVTEGLPWDFRTWAVSVGIIFVLFDRHVALHGPGLLSSYPTPGVRFLNVLWSAWEEIKKVVPDSFKAGADQTLRASVEMSDFFSSINMTTRPFSLVESTKTGQAANQELFAQVSALRDRLREIESEQMADLALERSNALRIGRTGGS